MSMTSDQKASFMQFLSDRTEKLVVHLQCRNCEALWCGSDLPAVPNNWFSQACVVCLDLEKTIKDQSNAFLAGEGERPQCSLCSCGTRMVTANLKRSI